MAGTAVRLDLVGNIRLASRRRLRYLLATLHSFAFIADGIGLHLNIENGRWLLSPLRRYLRRLGFVNPSLSCDRDDYGRVYSRLLRQATNAFVMHLEEDHFCVLDDPRVVAEILRVASDRQVDAAVVTFHPWISHVLRDASWEYEDAVARILVHDRAVFDTHVRKHRGYYLGNNMLFHKAFALRFWARNLDARTPHAYELREWSPEFEHRLLLPKVEILRPIDDDHGVPGSCCLNRPEGKWARLDGAVNLAPFAGWLACEHSRIMRRRAASVARTLLARARNAGT